MNKNQTCVIISSYPQSHLDSSLLSLTIESWTQQGYDICLTTHSPVNQDIQKAVKYYIYTDENEMLVYDDISTLTWFYGTEEFTYQTNWGNTMGKHSYAILNNIKNSLQLLESKNYTNFIFIDDDIFLTTNDHLLLEEKFIETNFIEKDYWFFVEHEAASLAVSNCFGGKIAYFKEVLSKTQTPQDYLDYCRSTKGFSLENYLGKAFLLEGNGNGHYENYPLRHLFKNEWIGTSQGGNVYIPGLKHKDWWLDIVKDNKDSDSGYAIIYETKYQFNIQIVCYKDEEVYFETEITTGPLYWFKLNLSEGGVWRLEQKLDGKAIKQVEYTTQQIIDNNSSFMDFN